MNPHNSWFIQHENVTVTVAKDIIRARNQSDNKFVARIMKFTRLPLICRPPPPLHQKPKNGHSCGSTGLLEYLGLFPLIFKWTQLAEDRLLDAVMNLWRVNNGVFFSFCEEIIIIINCDLFMAGNVLKFMAWCS